MQYISDEQWQQIRQVIPQRPPTAGRQPREDRPVLEAILHVILNNIAWMDLPECHPPYATAFRRYNAWVKNGTWEQILDTLYVDLFNRTGFNIWRAWLGRKLLFVINGKAEINLPDELNQPPNIFVVLLFLRGIQHQRKEEELRGVKS